MGSLQEALEEKGLLTSEAKKKQQLKEGTEHTKLKKQQKDRRLFDKNGIPKINGGDDEIFPR